LGVPHGSTLGTLLFKTFINDLSAKIRSRGSSGSIVSDYGLDDQVIEVRSPTVADFFLAPASRPALGPTQPPSRGPFPGGKARSGRDADHSPPSSAEVKNEWELYLLYPHVPPWRVAGQLYFTSAKINHSKFLLLAYDLKMY
jgi:hypothetical protein